jgi:hypothetical protein
LAAPVHPLWVLAVQVTGFASIAVSLSGFVGAAMVWFAATGFCIMANGLYWLGAEPRLVPSGEPPKVTQAPVTNPHAPA